MVPSGYVACARGVFVQREKRGKYDDFQRNTQVHYG